MPDDIALIPYVKLKNGQWIMEESIIRDFWKMLLVDGTVKAVFYGGTVQTEDKFVEFLQDRRNSVVTMWSGGDPSGIAWINGYIQNYAFGHFVFFKKGKNKVECGKRVLDYWLSLHKDGMHFFDIIVGLIPVINEKAQVFVEKIGMTHLGVIPKMAYDFYGDRFVGMSIFYVVRR